MPDDTTNRGPADRARVNIHEEWELKYWTKRFGVSRATLTEVVKKVGVMVQDVERELQQTAAR